MPTTAINYAHDFQIPDLIQRDLGCALTCPVYRAGALVAPTVSGSSFSLYRPDRTKLLDATAITVAGDIAQVTVTSDDVASEALGMGWRAEWKLVISGKTYAFQNGAGIVRAAPSQAAHQGDLTARHTNLTNWLQGTGETSLQKWLDQAWYELTRWLIKKGSRPHLMVEQHELKDLHAVWTLRLFFQDLIGAPNPRDEFLRLRDDYAATLKDEMASASFTYDTSDDGAADTKKRAVRPVTFLGNGEDWTPGRYEPHGGGW